MEKRKIRFTDTIDADLVISLFEHGIIRNPKTGRCVVCQNASSDFEWWKKERPVIRAAFISLDDVRETIINAEKGFFDYVGCGRALILSTLNNGDLSNLIIALESYNGAFNLYE